jgi:hypothetical protein
MISGLIGISIIILDLIDSGTLTGLILGVGTVGIHIIVIFIYGIDKI